MAIERRRRLPDPPPKTEIERAAIAACISLNRECACTNAPGTCQAMVTAITLAFTEVAPDVLMRFYKAGFDRRPVPRT